MARRASPAACCRVRSYRQIQGKTGNRREPQLRQAKCRSEPRANCTVAVDFQDRTSYFRLLEY
jgi:hypothetical protein